MVGIQLANMNAVLGNENMGKKSKGENMRTKFITSTLIMATTCLLFMMSSANANDSLFSAPNYYDVGDRPQAVIAEDFDGDGNLDLATVHEFSNDVSILLNNGDATFSAEVRYDVGSAPFAICAADFDNDGDNDLAIPNKSSNYVSILMNNGDGTFAPQVTLSVGSHPCDVSADDLDGDGDVDLAVTNRYGANISILKNNGDGTFASHVMYPVGQHPWSIYAADLDGDNDYDLAVANLLSHNVSVLKNNGDGTFAAHSTYGVGTRPASVCAADLDGDTYYDLVTTNYNSGNISVLRNLGDGTFATHVTYDVGYKPRAVCSADLDGDNDNDLAVANYGYDGIVDDTISILMNNGDGTFAPAVNYNGAGDTPTSVFLVDIDDDTDQDMIIANGHTDNISVYFNRSCSGTPPHLIGTCDTPGEAQAVYINDGLAYLADGQSGFHVIDVSTPSNPMIIGSEATSDRARDVYISGNHAFIPHANTPPSGNSGLAIIDITSSSSPNMVYNHLTPHKARGVYVLGNYAYVADDRSPLQILDISDPANPIEVGSISTPGYNYDVFVKGAYAYVACTWTFKGLAIYDISDPSTPSLVSTVATLDHALRIHLSGDYAYVAARNSGLYIVDISDPSNPNAIGHVPALSRVLGVFASGDYAYVADSDFGLLVIDVSDPNNPQIVGRHDTPDYAYDVFVKNGYAYVPDRYTGLLIFDVSGYAGSIAPVAAFSAEPTSGYAPLTVNFTDESTGDITSWEWDFGDGTTSTEQNPTHIYMTGGLYTVTLTVTGPGGSDSITYEQLIEVITPVAFDIKPGSCPNPLNVKAFGQSWLWVGDDDDNVTPNESVIMNEKKRPLRRKKAVLPTAILGSADFDVAQIDIGTVTLNGVPVVRYSYDDVAAPLTDDAEECACNTDGPDGYGDLTMKFNREEIITSLGTVHDGQNVPLIIAGLLTDGRPFESIDCVLILDFDGGEELNSADPVTSTDNYPNPFNPTTTISFTLRHPSQARLDIFNIAGQKVTTLVNRSVEAGRHSVIWDGRDDSGTPVASGMYFYRLEADGYSTTKKMVLLK